MCVPAATVCAQNYPNRPLRIVVGFTAGGAVDFAARVVGQKLTEQYGQPVVIENRPGASTVIATERVVTAAADGYTLLLIPISTAVQSGLRKNLPYDLQRDLAAVSQLATGPIALMVHPSLPVKTVKDFIAYAREQPGKVSLGVPGMGSANHLAGELLAVRAQIKFLQVPYKGASEAVVALAAGQTSAALLSVAGILSLLESGKVRTLAVTSAKRVSTLPGVPTIDESILPGYSYEAWYGVAVPAAVPKAIIAQFNGALGRIVRMPDIRDAFQKQGMEPQAGTPEQFAAVIAREIEQTVKLQQIAGIKAE
jgi:tripartite-type tricarboxylate transporter receptor subunit TctC